MPKVDLKITSTAAVEGTKQTTTVNYVNPNATNDVLKEFAQKLNAFTTNTYGEANRIETVNVDTEGSRKIWHNITTENISRGATNATAVYEIKVGTTPTPTIFFDSNNTVTKITVTFQPGAYATQGKARFTVPDAEGWLIIGFTSGTTFYSEMIAVQVP